MFTKFPPLAQIETTPVPDSMIKTFLLFHSTVNDISYRSKGDLRKNEKHCIFHYTIKGHGEVIYKGVPYITNEGEGFFNIINESNSGYGYPQSETEPWEFVVFCFKDGNIMEIVEELLESSVIYKVSHENIFMLCNKLLERSGSAAINCFPELISMIYSAQQQTMKISPVFQNIVERDLMKNPTVYAIAAEMNISREHLQREYFKETGETPATYIRSKRFEKLCYLLMASLSETDIVEMMNFSSVSEMRLFFKRNTGITPHRYRKTGYFST